MTCMGAKISSIPTYGEGNLSSRVPERSAGKGAAVSPSRHPGRAGGPSPSLFLGLPPQPGAPTSRVTATPAVMKGGGGEVCGREAAIREPETFDMQQPPAPMIALAGLVPEQAPSPGYQGQTSCQRAQLPF